MGQRQDEMKHNSLCDKTVSQQEAFSDHLNSSVELCPCGIMCGLKSQLLGRGKLNMRDLGMFRFFRTVSGEVQMRGYTVRRA